LFFFILFIWIIFWCFVAQTLKLSWKLPSEHQGNSKLYDEFFLWFLWVACKNTMTKNHDNVFCVSDIYFINCFRWFGYLEWFRPDGCATLSALSPNVHKYVNYNGLNSISDNLKIEAHKLNRGHKVKELKTLLPKSCNFISHL